MKKFYLLKTKVAVYSSITGNIVGVEYNPMEHQIIQSNL